MRDKLLGALVGLARASEGKELLPEARDALILGLAFSRTGRTPGKSCPAEEQEYCADLILRLNRAKLLMSPDCASCQCPCGRTDDYDLEEVYHSSENLKNAKLKLFDLLGTIAERLAEQKTAPETCDPELLSFLSESLFLIGCTFEAGQLSAALERADQYLSPSAQ